RPQGGIVRRPLHLIVLPLVLATVSTAAAQQAYVPPPGSWEHRDPAQVGMRADRLAEAVRFAQANESPAPRDLELAHYMSFGREPFGAAVGPFKERGPQTGLIIRNGYIVAEWGDPA